MMMDLLFPLFFVCVCVCLFLPSHSLTRGSTIKTSRINVPTATVPTQTPHHCRSTCRRTPSKTLKPTAAVCVAGRTPQWVNSDRLRRSSSLYVLVFSEGSGLGHEMTWCIIQVLTRMQTYSFNDSETRNLSHDSWRWWTPRVFSPPVSSLVESLNVCGLVAGDLPNEAHVQTHGGGAPGEPPVASEDRVPQHPHTHLPHLSPSQQDGWSRWSMLRLELKGPVPRPPHPTPGHLHKAYISIWQLT